MHIQRNIIYSTCILYLFSIIGLFAKVQNITSICCGVLSSAVIGLITSKAYYTKARAEYFAELNKLLKSYFEVFCRDENLTRQSIEYLRAHTLEEILQCRNLNDFEPVNSAIIERYTELAEHFNVKDFASLNPFDKITSTWLEELDIELWFARNEMIMFHNDLSCVLLSKNEEDIEDCIYSRTMVYTALDSAIRHIYDCSIDISRRCKLNDTEEYKSWLFYGDKAIDAINEHRDSLLLLDGDIKDEIFDEGEID